MRVWVSTCVRAVVGSFYKRNLSIKSNEGGMMGGEDEVYVHIYIQTYPTRTCMCTCVPIDVVHEYVHT